MPVDIVLLSNGPGEVTTWVRPVAQALRQKLGEDREQVRISLLLSPCPHAMGNEGDVARRYGDIDRAQDSADFFRFLLTGKTAENWDWRRRGVVVFLGGDQFYALWAGKRLGYKTVVYAEWEARWSRWIDAFGVMRSAVVEKMPPQHRSKARIVGDLMADLAPREQAENNQRPRIGLFPGSKPFKLAQGAPLALAAAAELAQSTEREKCPRFQLFLAPTVDLKTLARYADPAFNPLAETLTELKLEPQPHFPLPNGAAVEIISQFPAEELMKGLAFAITTVGANTAQLGALGVPMLVLLPTQHLESMKLWDGLPGLLTRLPGVGSVLARWLNARILRQNKLYAWPNLWARREIVPEWLGEITPGAVAQQARDWLTHPEKLALISAELRKARGPAGAAQKLADLVIQILEDV